MAWNARIAEFVAPLKVEPGSRVVLAKRFDPASKAGIESKKKGREFLAEGVELLAEYQARLAAQDTYGVLVVLQALDAAGKDGTIRHVMSGVNPQGVVGRTASRSPRPRSSTTTSSGATKAAARRGRDRHLQPLAL